MTELVWFSIGVWTSTAGYWLGYWSNRRKPAPKPHVDLAFGRWDCPTCGQVVTFTANASCSARGSHCGHQYELLPAPPRSS